MLTFKVFICINISFYQLLNLFFLYILANKFGDMRLDLTDDQLINIITSQFNDSLHFDPNNVCMAYTIRDPVGRGRIWAHKHLIYLTIWYTWYRIYNCSQIFWYHLLSFLEDSLTYMKNPCNILSHMLNQLYINKYTSSFIYK